jgi:hypothetical protein
VLALLEKACPEDNKLLSLTLSRASTPFSAWAGALSRLFDSGAGHMHFVRKDYFTISSVGTEKDVIKSE